MPSSVEPASGASVNPSVLLSESFWLLPSLVFLVVAWSMPVVAQALYAEDRVLFSLAFALGWSGLMTGLGLLFYLRARSNSQMASMAIVLALATLALLYRIPSTFIEPQFKAEDATIFFAQQRAVGMKAFLLPYNGYYHTVVRLGAALIAPFPTLFAPALYNLFWLAIYSLVIVYIMWQWPDKKWGAVAAALVPAYISHTCEVFMCLTNAIWIAGLGLTAFLLFPVPQVQRWVGYVITGFLLVFSLSGPFSVILTPFYLLRWIANRKTFPLRYFVVVATGALVQMSALHVYYAGSPPGPAATSSNFLLCLKIAVLRIPWSLAVGYQPLDPYWLIGLVLFLVLLGFTGWEIKSNFQKQIFALCCLFVCATYVMMDFVRISPLDVLVPLINGDRYFYIPKVLMVWALISLAANARNPRPFYLALLFCFLGSMVEFTNVQTLIDNNWPHYAVLIDQGQPVKVPVNPPGWTVLINSQPVTPGR